jgi:hypothetical protein
VSDAAALIARAAAFARDQRMEEALEAVSAAARLAPNDARAAIGRAQLSFETWRPAAALFARARSLAPYNLDLIRNHALALAADGERAAAALALETALEHAPFWADGHRALATLRITGAEDGAFDRSYARACRLDGAPPALWMGWFQQHATLKRWDDARRILDEARTALGQVRTLDMAALFLDSESGAGGDLEPGFEAFSALNDPGLDLCRTRCRLRRGAPDAAAAVAMKHIARPSARAFWPYLSLCWRLTNDKRAAWLDGDPLFAACVDLDFSPDELTVLADLLRSLHRLKAPYPEQSVRGGVQTDRQLFFHPDKRIQSLRAKASAAVGAYAAALPARDPAHPLLSQRRDSVAFEGSWSVRLDGAGYHHPHTHVLGWISSAFYVALPDATGPEPAGRLTLGAPPPELGLPLGPYRRIEPKPARLALFPATLWHSTEPFPAGERLTVAFDVRLPGP